ncbi:branched-chain amino acid ABC transporter permease [Nitratireductor aestuarii]|uniref:Branched-chain amino acid ABC transporter permease n=1 Tax=Nitratireductor aestuarii TaxID=1735103 RepID=A0A916W9M5_9HYPH|nr:branched-chain amino acid ABC transporter permease [Nitratireductor aestuarii]GGA78880.1 branched-chain amino acid ABC transporter permease [Nitratireductor aestuarii]
MVERFGYVGWVLLLGGLVGIYLLNDGYYTTVALLMMLWAILAIGLNFILGYAGYFHLGLGAFYGLGAYGAAALGTKYQMPMIVALIVMPIAGAILSAIIGPLLLRTRDLYFAVATLALGMIISDVTNNWVSVTGGPIGIGGIQRPGVIGFGAFSIDGRTLPGMFIIVSTIFVALMIAAAIARKSNFVLILRGIKSDDLMTRSFGFPTTVYKVAAFAIAGAISALGGVLYAHIVQYISPEPFTFFAASFQAFVVLAVGGLGSLWGPVLGSVLLTGLPEFLDLDPHMKLIIYGAVLLIVTLVLPKGLASAAQVISRRRKTAMKEGTE